MNKQTTGRRIVSREEFVSQVGKKVGLSALGIVVCGLSGAACILLALTLMLATSGGNNAPLTALLGFSLLISSIIFFIGTKICRRAEALKMDVPLTRHNSSDLAAEESLVRASQEPAELQQVILLRAASQSDTTPPDLLLRPASTEQTDVDVQSKLTNTTIVWKTPIEETQVQENRSL